MIEILMTICALVVTVGIYRTFLRTNIWDNPSTCPVGRVSAITVGSAVFWMTAIVVGFFL